MFQSRRPIRPWQILLLSCLAVCACLVAVAVIRPPPVQRSPLRRPVVPERPASPAPPELAARIQALGQRFEAAGKHERVGIAVADVRDGWIAEYRGGDLYPQQSVSKLWVATTLLDAVDRGERRLDEGVVVRRQDLSVFFQPIRRCVGPEGYATTLGALLERAISVSDNTANDVLMRQVGGQGAVDQVIVAKGLGQVSVAGEERQLQSRIAGLAWREEYGLGGAFKVAREALPSDLRWAAMDRYLAEPYDGAAPIAIARDLARLSRGELLSGPSTALLLKIMTGSRNGPRRLKGGLPPGWSIAHKTGTGQVLGALSTGFNDVGVITAPDGHAYAVAVMIASTQRPIPGRLSFMSDVSRAVVAQHEGRDPSAAAPAPQAGASGEIVENREESGPLSKPVPCP